MVFSALSIVYLLTFRGFCTLSEIGFSGLFFKRGVQTSPLVSAHPSWSLIKSRSERQSHVGFGTVRSSNPSSRVHAMLGTTTAKGQYTNAFCESIHYAFGCVRVACTVRACALHFDFGVEQVCSAAARVTSSPPFTRSPLRLCLVLPWGSVYEATPHAEVRCPLALLPPSLSISSLSTSPIRGVYFNRGRRMWFPSAFKLVFGHRVSCSSPP